MNYLLSTEEYKEILTGQTKYMKDNESGTESLNLACSDMLKYLDQLHKMELPVEHIVVFLYLEAERSGDAYSANEDEYTAGGYWELSRALRDFKSERMSRFSIEELENYDYDYILEEFNKM